METTNKVELVRPHAVTSSKGLFYGGGWHEAQSGSTATIRRPATGDSLGTVAWAEPKDVELAVAAASAGFQTWRAVAPLERCAIMRRAAEVIRKHAHDIASLEAADTGVPYARMASDALSGALASEFFACLVTELKGTTVP